MPSSQRLDPGCNTRIAETGRQSSEEATKSFVMGTRGAL
jgi:hypothetical protein